MFFEQSPRYRNSPISGSVTFDADSGAVITAADGYSGPRWLTALERLTTSTAAWSWCPAIDHKPSTLEGNLRLGPSITAESRLGGAPPTAIPPMRPSRSLQPTANTVSRPGSWRWLPWASW
ncbi:hypothetical protein [Streptomyces luteosporeus]|uniref:Uncharacterized protein n=1 Tax=Streptomyces luteosporeus TaxID=173856 RepID=A0ABP6GFE0_9ACTN